MAWIKESSGLWMQQKPLQKVKSIKGHYTLKIILNPPDKRHRDMGNSEKAASDFIQRMGIIEDDYLCRKLEIVWGDEVDAPNGMCLVVSSVDEAKS